MPYTPTCPAPSASRTGSVTCSIEVRRWIPASARTSPAYCRRTALSWLPLEITNGILARAKAASVRSIKAMASAPGWARS